MGREQLVHDRRDRRRVADHAQALGLNDRLGRAALGQQLGQQVFSDFAADHTAIDQLHHLSELLGLER